MIVIVSGCQNLPSPGQTESADYGPYPEDYKTITTNFLKSELKDPDKVETKEFSEPKKRWIGDTIRGTEFGYLICVEVNSANFFGNMTGWRTDALLIRNNEVIKYVKDGELLGGMKLCD